MTSRRSIGAKCAAALVAGALVAASGCSARNDGTSGRYARRADCDGIHDDCTGGGLCCPGMQCGWGLCCVSAGHPCSHDGECCSNECNGGMCRRSPAGEACASSAECAPGLECDVAISTCKVAPGGYCRNAFDCMTSECAAGTCLCGQLYDLCVADSDCCAGTKCVGSGYCDAPP